MTELTTVTRDMIIPGKRFREDFGDLTALATSIKEKGLIQPLACTPQDGKYLLLAGERRFRACELVELNEIPIRVFPEGIDELTRREIEAEENFQRLDMSWEERALLVEEIHRLKQAKYGQALPGSSGGWGVRDTAEVAGKNVSIVHTELKLAKALKENPELFEGCKNRREAEKVLNKVEEAMIMDELAKRAKKDRPLTPVAVQQLLDSYMVGDFFDLVKGVPDGSINCVELDPDFAIDVKDLRGQVSRDNAYVQVTKDDFPTFFPRVLDELNRVMTQHGWIICWYGFEWQGFVMDAFRSKGFSVSNTPGVWLKDRVTGVSNQPYMNLDPQTELFMIVRRGSPSFNKPGRSNVFMYNRIPTAEKAHPFERPLALMRDIMDTVAFPKTRWLVPFAGSGKTMLAAQHLDMHAIGFDLAQEYKNTYDVRITQPPSDEWKMC